MRTGTVGVRSASNGSGKASGNASSSGGGKTGCCGAAGAGGARSGIGFVSREYAGGSDGIPSTGGWYGDGWLTSTNGCTFAATTAAATSLVAIDGGSVGNGDGALGAIVVIVAAGGGTNAPTTAGVSATAVAAAGGCGCSGARAGSVGYAVDLSVCRTDGAAAWRRGLAEHNEGYCVHHVAYPPCKSCGCFGNRFVPSYVHSAWYSMVAGVLSVAGSSGAGVSSSAMITTCWNRHRSANIFLAWLVNASSIWNAAMPLRSMVGGMVMRVRLNMRCTMWDACAWSDGRTSSSSTWSADSCDLFSNA